MPPALQLPIELFHHISQYFERLADLSSWSRSCRALYIILTPLLLHKGKDDPAVLCWACDKGHLNTINSLLDAGANVNVAEVRKVPRWWSLADLKNQAGAPREVTLQQQQQQQQQQQAEERNEVIQEMSEWLLGRAAIDPYETIKHFEEDYYIMGDEAARAELQRQRGVVFSTHAPLRGCYWTPLHVAAAQGNDKLVNLLLDHGADVNAISRLFCPCATLPDVNAAPLWTPLHSSMCHGHESTTRLLLSRGASINITTRHLGSDQRRFTALHSACMEGSLGAVRALVDGGYQTDVTVHDHKNMTPFAYAFVCGSWAVVDYLLEHGADINSRIGPINALGHACLMGYYAEALRLLDLGAEPQSDFGVHGEDPVLFHLIAVAGALDIPSSRSFKQREFRLELMNRLIKYGIDVNHRGHDGSTALTEAAYFLRTDVVKALLHSGADVHANDSGLIALVNAVSLCGEKWQKAPRGTMLNTVRLLLEAMMETPAPAPSFMNWENAKESDTTGDVDIAKALLMACKSPYKHEDKLEVVALLLGYKRAVEVAKEDSGLVYASLEASNFDISDLLLESGFTRPSRAQLNTLAYQFLQEDSAEELDQFLNRFSDQVPRIRSGQILCDAVDDERGKCVELLLNKGASIDIRNDEGNSLLFTACLMEDSYIAEILLRHGADPDECSRQGHSMMTVAALYEKRNIIKVLLDYGASIHSLPPKKPALKPYLGALDVALEGGLISAVEEMVAHQNFGSPTDEEISTHWHTIINSPAHIMNMVTIVEILLKSKKFDKDQIITTTDVDTGSVALTTPLHLFASNSRLGKTKIINKLLKYGADIHKYLPVIRNNQIYTIRLDSQVGGLGLEFEGTTPLGWAIEFSPFRVVQTFLDHNRRVTPKIEDTEEISTANLMLCYAKAACRRQYPKTMSLLFEKGLDNAICDEDGNTIIHMICDNVETFWPNDDPDWTMEIIAMHSASCLVVCLEWAVKYQLRNKRGVSGMDRVLEILNYSGNCEFHQTLSRKWRDVIDYVEDPSPTLTPKRGTPDN
ncbi:ankyrin repeat-containing domain protein [Xylaria sp. FL1777]|nr:ankyrin repeat-containing domain protein [Xylaria sp. FL1777]